MASADGANKDMTPQEEELLKYLEDLQASNPSEYEMLVKELQEKEMARTGKMPGGQGQGEQVVPTPGFVAKTRSATKGGAKVFVNVCSSEHVDKPAPVENAENSEEVQMRIPLSLGPPREDLDKSGDVCTVYDVVFHPEAVEGALKEEEFRGFVMQLTVYQIQQKFQDELSLDFSYPKVKGNYKGIAPLPQFMRKKGVPPPPPPGSQAEKELQAAQAAEAAAKASGKAVGPGGKPLVEEMAEPTAETLPAPSYAVEPRRIGGGSGEADGVSIKVHLPSVDDGSEIEVQMTSESLELLVPRVCALSLQLPRAVLTPPLAARFETERKVLSLLLRADQGNTLNGGVSDMAGGGDGASGAAAAAGAGGAEAAAPATPAMDAELARREREREARLNARRRRAAGNQQLQRQAEAEEAAAAVTPEDEAASAVATGDDEAPPAADASDAAAADEASSAEAKAEASALAKKKAQDDKDKDLELTNSIMFELED